MLDFALLLLRVEVGALIAAHGAQKLFGAWNGPGWQGHQQMMARLKLWPVPFWGAVSALAEFGGGLLIILGFLWPLGPLALIAAMSMAIISVHWPKGFWNSKGGIEFPLTLLTIGIVLGLVGPGLYSIDALIHLALPVPEPGPMIAGLILVVLGLLAALNSHALRGAVTRTPEPGKEHTHNP